jgi:hypothetical protein
MKLQKNHERRSSEKPHGGKPSVKGPWRVTTPKGVKSWSGGVTTHNDASTGDESYILTETDLDATGRYIFCLFREDGEGIYFISLKE